MVKMILSNIEPIHIDGLNCFEEAVLSVIGILYSDYYILFWDRWGFSYNVRKNKKYMGELINRGINGLLPNLEMLYGIKVKKIKIDGKLSCLGFIKETIKNDIPLITFMDTFCCPWHRDYKKEHHVHYLVIVGVEREEKLICVDATFLKRDVLLPIELFWQGAYECEHEDFSQLFGIYVFDFLNIKDVDTRKNEAHQMMIGKMIRNSIYKDVLLFAGDFKESFDFKHEYEKFAINITDVPMDRHLGLISGQRVLFSYFLQIMQYQNIDIVREMLILLAKKWKGLRFELRKCFYTGFTEEKQKKLYESIIQLAYMEKKAVQRFIENFNGDVI